MNVRDVLDVSTARLEAVSDTPRLDAELLVAHALGVSREAMLLNHLEATTPPAFEALLLRRLAYEPVAYLTGRRAFWTIALEVGPGVLIPRPDSETLVEAAVARFGDEGPRSVLDLGTGPGTLLLAALDQWRDASGLGVDASEAALAYARRNARRLGLSGRASFRRGDWDEGVDGRFDLILVNPPYVEAGAELPAEIARWEPEEALYAGADGLAAYRRLAPRIGRLLAPGGIACVEIGAGQEKKVGALFAAQGFTIESRSDLGGIVRCLIFGLDRE